MATQADAELWIGIDERHIRSLERRVPEMRAARKRDDWQTYVRLACDYYRGVAANRKAQREPEELDLVTERARLAKEQADHQELKNAQLRGELLERSEVETTWARMILAAKERLRSIPATARVRIPGLTPAQAVTLRDLIDEALTELADDGTPKLSMGEVND